MLRSSLGFHTLTLILVLLDKEARQLMQHFKKYSRDTGLIQIYPEDGKQLRLKYESSGDGTQKTEFAKNKNFRVVYYQEDRGIEWLIRYNNWSGEFKSYIVEVTINPKILSGISDYITTATFDDMGTAINNFNRESERISPLLGNFNWYKFKRVDYCLNFDIEELGTHISPEKMMELIQKSDIPPHYKEWTKYCDTSHRKVGRPGSFYLIGGTLNINIYSKYMELQERSRKRVEKGLPPIPQDTIDAARNIIRFELQYKYRKTYALSRKVREADNKAVIFEHLLSHEACYEAIRDYFNKVIGSGHWHTLQGAIRIIESQGFNQQKESRLIEALQLVNRCRSIATAKASLQGRNLDAFKETLKDLSVLNINPVTIPKEWGVKHIPNLLYTYYDKVQEEKNAKLREEWRLNNLEDCIRKYGYPFD